MESLYQPGKKAIPTWRTGTTIEANPDKANELVLPEGRRP
jgi:hypothetical protein